MTICVNRVVLMILVSGLAVAVGTGPANAGEAIDMPQVGGAGVALPGPAQAGDLLPIKRITLYRSGVGAFQREGLVEGNAQVSLKFDQTQINDILKSLQLLDLDGGRIDSVGYASKDPLARRLNSFSVPIADNPSMSALLTRLRGAKVTIAAAEGDVSGTILGVETRKVQPTNSGKDAPAIDAPFVTLVTGTGIRAVNINGITNFQITDKALADELNKALMAVSDTRGDRVKSVDLSLSGNGGRRIAVRYVHETPVWKTSYRLIIDDSPEARKKAEAEKKSGDTLALQGWAIVENTTDTDWKDVKLALVSGRPVSFQMDLSEPMYMTRPDIAVPTIPGVMPKNYAAGVDLRPLGTAGLPPASAAPSMARGAMKSQLAPGSPGGNRAEARMSKEALADSDGRFFGGGLSADDLTRYSPQSQAQAGQIGEVFFFEVQNTITVERQRSAMIPFLSENIAGRRVSIYNMADRADFPMRGVELTNSSNTQLLPGPLAVFDGTAYAGDATINQVSPGDKRLLAYAVDLDVVVTTKPEGSGDITKLKIVNGVFEQTLKRIDSMTYTFSNKDLKRSRTIIVEHPKLPGWTLAAPEKAADTTQDLYRFEVTAEAGKNAVLPIRQEVIERQQVGLETYDIEVFAQWKTKGAVSAAVLQAMAEIGKRKSAINQSERAVGELDKQIDTNTKEQTRISETMQRLPQNGELYGDYTKELKELNNALKPIRTQRKGEFDKLETLRRDFADYVSKLNVE